MIKDVFTSNLPFIYGVYCRILITLAIPFRHCYRDITASTLEIIRKCFQQLSKMIEIGTVGWNISKIVGKHPIGVILKPGIPGGVKKGFIKSLYEKAQFFKNDLLTIYNFFGLIYSRSLKKNTTLSRLWPGIKKIEIIIIFKPQQFVFPTSIS